MYRRCQAAATRCALKAQLCTPSTARTKKDPRSLLPQERERGNSVDKESSRAPALNPPTEFEAFCQRHPVRVLQISAYGNA
jgi:hypothetical protein